MAGRCGEPGVWGGKEEQSPSEKGECMRYTSQKFRFSISSSLYILGTDPVSVRWIVNVFSLLVVYLIYNVFLLQSFKI